MDKIAQSVRLAAVTGMTGKRWVDVAQQIGAGQTDREQLIRLGLDESQCQQYYDYNENNLTEVYSWLAQSPAHHLVTALDAAYPAVLKKQTAFRRCSILMAILRLSAHHS